MPRNEVISVNLDIPDELQSEEEIQQYIAKNIQKFIQARVTNTEQVKDSPSSTSDSSSVQPPPVPRPNASTMNIPPPGGQKVTPPKSETQQELEAAEVQLARLYRRYNMVASRIHGATRRKLLLRSISREEARIQHLKSTLKGTSS